MSRKSLLMVLFLALAAVATVGVAAQSGGAAGNVTSGEYGLADLQDGGTWHTGEQTGPASQRFMSEYGSATIRFEPVGPLAGDWQYLEPGTTLHSDTITLRTVRLAPSEQLDRDLTVTIVAWEKGEREVVRNNQTVTRPAAINQTVRQQSVTLGRGYDEATIRLPSNYDETKTVTMWIEEYPDARWKFQHRSVPSTQKVDIDTAGEAWNYTATNAVLPGALGILLGLIGARSTLKHTTSGPRWGLGIWAILSGILLFSVLSAAYFQVAVVLTYFPWLLGGVLAVLAYGGGLWMAGSPSKVGFYRVELFDARLGPGDRGADVVDVPGDAEPVADGGVLAVNGDEETAEEATSSDKGPGSGLSEIKEVRYVDLEELPAMERPDGKIGVPKRGLRPFLARLFADAATLDKSDLTTKIAVDEGRLDEIVMVDPESDEPVIHNPAHLERRWPVLHSLDEDADIITKFGKLAGMLLLVVGVPLAGWTVGGQLGVPVLGAFLGVLPALVAGHEAKDGSVEYEPASQHFRRAQATLIDLQREQADGKTLEDFRQMAWSERARTAQEAQEIAEDHDRTLTEQLLSQHSGFNLADPEDGEASVDTQDRDPDAGGEDSDA
ncbi:hypothetical protein ACKVMT_07040 [Halobacteriales archaeon Cl-PHB]